MVRWVPELGGCWDEKAVPLVVNTLMRTVPLVMNTLVLVWENVDVGARCSLSPALKGEAERAE